MTDDLTSDTREDTAAVTTDDNKARQVSSRHRTLTDDNKARQVSSRHRTPLEILSNLVWGAPTPAGTKFVQKATGASARNWNFLAARPPGKRTTAIEAAGHLIKSCLGGGIVSIHEAYMMCGLWLATVLNVILGFLVSYVMIILAKSAQKAYGRTRVPMMTYPDLAEASLAISPWPKLRRHCKHFRYMVDATIMIDLFGSCCCYQVIIARSLKQLVEGTEKVSDDGIRLYILALLIPCILICMIRTLKLLAPFSLVADGVIILVAVTTVVYGKAAAKVPLAQMSVYKNFAGLLEYLGVCVFSMEGVGATLAIENSMKEPKKIVQVLTGGMVIVVAMVMMVGFFGYWGYGEASKSPVTLNFEFNNYTTFLKAALPAMVYVTFALNFWVPFELAWHYLSRRHEPDRYWFVERVYRAIFVIGITGVAVAFPDVSKLIGVIGAFCLSNMGFIYPAFIELALDWEDPGLGKMKWRFWKFFFFFVFGLFLMILGTFSNVKELIKSVYGDKKVAVVPTTEASAAGAGS